MSEPGVLQLVYDSVREIRQATADIADEQAVQGRRLEAALGRMETITHRLETAERERAKLEGRLDAVEERVNDLRRVAWILTVAGGMLVAIVTSVASDFAGRMFDPPTRPAFITPAHPPTEGS